MNEQHLQKKIYLEYLRVIACALVIFNHLGGYGLYMVSNGARQSLYMILAMITRINVPVFFMISGSLLLGKDESFKTVFTKRVARISMVLLIFCGGLYLLGHFKSTMENKQFEFTLKSYIYDLLSGNIYEASAYWYLYAYLSFLFVLPFLQRVARRIEKQDFIVLLVIHFLFSSFFHPVSLVLSGWGFEHITFSADFVLPLYTTKCFFYPIVGYYIDSKIDILKFKAKHIVILAVSAAIGIFISCWCTYYEAEITGEYTENYVQTFDYLTAIVVFLLVKYLVTVKVPKLQEGKIAKIVCLLGSLTFGIYLLDPYLKTVLYGKYNSVAQPLFPMLIVSLGWVIISIILGGIVTWVIKKLPVFRKLL